VTSAVWVGRHGLLHDRVTYSGPFRLVDVWDFDRRGVSRRRRGLEIRSRTTAEPSIGGRPRRSDTGLTGCIDQDLVIHARALRGVQILMKA